MGLYLKSKETGESSTFYIRELSLLLEEFYSTQNPNLKLSFTGKFGFYIKPFELVSVIDDLGDFSSFFKARDYDRREAVEESKRARINYFVKERLLTELVDLIKDGIPDSHRKSVYSILLNTPKKSVLTCPYDDLAFFADTLFASELKVINDDSRYFLFHSFVKKTLFYILRDPEILLLLQVHKPHFIIQKQGNQYQVFPPSGILPVVGMAYLVVPFCYLSEKFEEVYLLFKYFYCKHLCFLHSFDLNEKSVLCTFVTRLALPVPRVGKQKNKRLD